MPLRASGSRSMTIIRPLEPADAGAYQTLRLRALLDRPAAFASSHEEERDTPLSDVATRLAPREHGAVVLGAFEGESLVGMAGVQREALRKLAHKAVLWGVYVAPAARRRGIGRELVAAALARTGAMAGVRQILLGVNAANPVAIALYQSLGFQAFGVEPGFMLLDGTLHDEVQMVCRLDAA
jgi:ribosomal protein S18 acetylase RimI-like enzyme